MLTRRSFVKSMLPAACAVGRPRPVKAAQPAARSTDLLRLWAFSDPHVGTDKRFGRLSLAESLRQSELGGADGGPPFEWEIAVNLGDMSGGQAVPVDEEGEEAVRQFSALRKHRREDIYSLAGNHDRSGLDEPQNWWWRKWIDPTGEHTEHSGVDPSRRPYPIQGTWEHYSFRVGNILFLMMSDINEPTQKVGRGTLGGNPGGVVSGETFAWWRKMVGANQDSIIISAHHYMLKDTTVASGEWEGCRQKEDGTWVSHYHGYKARGTPKGASYLYWVNSVPDAQAFESYLAAHPGAIDMWLGGHTHTHPDDTYGNKSHIETKWGVHFINVAALTSRHAKTSVPMSRPLTIHGDELRVQCYMHTSDYAPQGWYAKAERNLKLNKRFHR